MVSKKVLISSIITVSVCLILSIVCAIVRKFDVVSAILLGAVIVFAIIVAVTCWRESVEQNRDKTENK